MLTAIQKDTLNLRGIKLYKSIASLGATILVQGYECKTDANTKFNMAKAR